MVSNPTIPTPSDNDLIAAQRVVAAAIGMFSRHLAWGYDDVLLVDLFDLRPGMTELLAEVRRYIATVGSQDGERG